MKKTLILNGERVEKTFEEILISYTPYLKKLSFQLIKSLSENRKNNIEVIDNADDVFQELSLRLMKIFDDYDIKKGFAFTTYMFKSLDGACLRLYRDELKVRNKGKNRTESFVISYDSVFYSDGENKDLLLGDAIPEPASEKSIESVINNIDLELAIKTLTIKEKEILTLYFLKDYTQQEVAKIANCTQVEVSRSLSKSTKKIKAYYDNNKADFLFKKALHDKGLINLKNKEKRVIDRKEYKNMGRRKEGKLLSANSYNKLMEYMVNNRIQMMSEMDFYKYATNNHFVVSEVFNSIKHILNSKEYIEKLNERKINEIKNVKIDETYQEIATEKVNNDYNIVTKVNEDIDVPLLNTTIDKIFVLDSYNLKGNICSYAISDGIIEIKSKHSEEPITIPSLDLDLFIKELIKLQKII